MVDYAERGRAAEKRHAAAKHRQRGLGKRDRVLERGQEIERSHNRAKNKARWRKPESELSPYEGKEYAAWRKRYFRVARPDLDPQSEESKWLEFFGLDNPYARNSDSFDYRQEKARESVASGNPDIRWFSPFDDDTTEAIVNAPTDFLTAIAGGNEVDIPNGMTPEEAKAEAAYEAAGDRAAFLQEHGRAPERGELFEIIQELQETHGRPPTEEEVIDALGVFIEENGREPYVGEFERLGMDAYKRYNDPRSRNEKMAGAISSALSWPFAGMQEEALAGIMSLAPGGGSYDEELEKAREIDARYKGFEPNFSPRNIAATVPGVVAGVAPYVAAGGAANFLLGAGRRAAGFAAKPATALGRFSTNAAAGAASFPAVEAASTFGEAEDGFENRMQAVENSDLLSSAIAGGIVWPIFGAAGRGIKRGGKSVVGAAGKVVKLLRGKRKPKPPFVPGQDAPLPQWPRPRQPIGATNAAGSVRGDINRAFASRAKPTRRTDAAIGIAAIPVGAATGGILYANERERQKRRKK